MTLLYVDDIYLTQFPGHRRIVEQRFNGRMLWEKVGATRMLLRKDDTLWMNPEIRIWGPRYISYEWCEQSEWTYLNRRIPHGPLSTRNSEHVEICHEILDAELEESCRMVWVQRGQWEGLICCEVGMGIAKASEDGGGDNSASC